MQLVTVMAVRYGGENKAALEHLIISSVCLQVHLKGHGEKLALLILVLILTEMTILQVISAGVMMEKCWCFQTPSVCSLIQTLACTDSSVLTLHFQNIQESFP